MNFAMSLRGPCLFVPGFSSTSRTVSKVPRIFVFYFVGYRKYENSRFERQLTKKYQFLNIIIKNYEVIKLI